MKKIIQIILIVIASIVILGIIFAVIDYFISRSGKKPIFIYHTVNVLHEDVNKEGTEYYGIGYKVTICDNSTENYNFQLGYKQKEYCYTSLTCNANEKGTLVLIDESTLAYDPNDKDNYEYSFFNGKLYNVKAVLIRPASSIENEELFPEEVTKFSDVPGCNGTGRKLSESAFETVLTCNISKMSSEDIDNYLPLRTPLLLEYTRDEIIDYHHNDLICE